MIISILALACAMAQETASPIKNVVLLMLENRSFDSVLGYINHNPEIDNLVGKRFCNRVNLTDAASESVCTSPNQPDVGPHNPDHQLYDATFQIYGRHRPTEKALSSTAPMSGFVAIAAQQSYAGDHAHLGDIMAGFDPKNIPIHRTLAEEYMVCDRWFASVPGPTHPNRQFVHAATSRGYINGNLRMLTGLPQRTIFHDMLTANKTWKSYYHSMPELFSFRTIRSQMYSRTSHISNFYHDSRRGKLAHYTFIEPNYGKTSGFDGTANDGHAEDGKESFARAELLLKNVYESIRNGPQWKSTLLVISYDEHGGFYDHVPPPTGVPHPDGVSPIDLEHPNFSFNFTRLGVRVPLILISPWVAKGSGIDFLHSIARSSRS